ncbi:helix-turn-helix transcriptional regulator [Leminorella grimontii]|uniref:helix-turn-helix transcriptional regulator n=1 Tax=Leminorella grimontii TaxID=82981 RepID=UPI00207E15BF|nr:AraC family transcriptional regulator [Leminorella grimontii]GKX60712.1 AraC family transcriptional regulator [Leminorella grimontii]
MQSALGQVKSVKQGYWRSQFLPHVELRSTYQSRVGYGEHLHRAFSIGAILEGQTCVRYLGQEKRAQAGELALIEPGAAHSCNPIGEQARSYHMLYINADWCLERLSSLLDSRVERLRCSCFSINDPALFSRYLSLVDALMQREPQAWERALAAFIDPLMLRYCSPDLPSTERGAVRFMRSRLQESLSSPPTLAELANDLNLRPETLIRAFYREVGMTPHAYVNSLRIEWAKSLLKEGESIADTAQTVGFSDQSHFHKRFVAATAATPGQYLLNIP